MLACLGALSLTACPANSSKPAPEVDAGGFDAGLSCVDDPLAETYMPGMQKDGSKGKFERA